MEENKMKLVITDNSSQSRFETEINGELAYLEYRHHNDNIVLVHTFVPESGRNHGVGFALAKFALEYAKDHKLKVIVYCPTVKKFLELHPEYEKLIEIRYHR
jgi:hypothetical protein